MVYIYHRQNRCRIGEHDIMKNYHVIIAKEYRTGTDREAINISDQLHSIGESITDNPNIIYATEWDGVADHATVLKGSMAGLTMAYAGWPMTDKPTEGIP